MSETAANTLQASPEVQALLQILQENRRDAGDLLEVFHHMGDMEGQLVQATAQLTAMRQELGEMRELQSHPIRTALQKVADALENGIADARAKLETVKARIVDGCKNAVAAFKENGVAALNGLARFFGVKDMLEEMHTSLNRCMNANENSIRRIAAFSAEYHQAGNHLKNMGRALVGKEPAPEAKPIGRLAKLAQTPYKVMYNAREKMLPAISKAIGRLESLENAAEKKPSIRGELNVYKKQAEQAALDAPKRQRTQTKEAAL